MRRIKLIVAYDGTNYCGWQVQPGQRTIEGELNKALSELLKEEIHVIGASRTDAGVHGLGNIAVFDTDSRIPGEKFSHALNQRLPEDIVVNHSEEVDPDYHPRKCSSVKTYEYQIWNHPFPNPMNRRYSAFVYVPLDEKRMQQAADYLVGEHDFTSFCSVATQVESKVRTIYSLKVSREGELITIRVQGNGFLYNMVRIIAGTLIKVGQGAIEPEQLPKILAAMDRQAAGPTAPPEGLTLVEIRQECE
ncbi:MAG: tRNA pseudouridine(38-40) synthase TruA [Lachnospiraceae bacterium]|nr:tRNA pseudouridine(38-40) synthase TruA [Lachnospiraceae bacterium]